MIVFRIVGGILLVIGLLLLALGLWFASHQILLGAAAFAISSFFLLTGYRLLLHRPNQYGSLLSPFGWRVLAGGFALAAVAMTTAARDAPKDSVIALFLLGVLVYACLVAARAARRRMSRIFSPATSLLRRKGFAPAGFQHGIEVLNDNTTPMQFVVDALRDKMGLSEDEAVRKMIEIHRQGGALFASASFEEAQRVADVITAEARRDNHVLTCRAVRLEDGEAARKN